MAATAHAASPPSEDNGYQADHARLLLDSYCRWTGKQLVPDSAAEVDCYRALYNAPFAVVSHNTDADPIFNYANRTAQALFEMDWLAITRLPSRKSAEPVNRAERERSMRRVTEAGFVDSYRGVRISSTGRRFRIEEAVIWNLLDQHDQYRGQAAVLKRWTML